MTWARAWPSIAPPTGLRTARPTPAHVSAGVIHFRGKTWELDAVGMARFRLRQADE